MRYEAEFVYTVFALLMVSRLKGVLFFFPFLRRCSRNYYWTCILSAMLFFRKSAFLCVSWRCYSMFWLCNAIIIFRFKLVLLLLAILGFAYNFYAFWILSSFSWMD